MHTFKTSKAKENILAKIRKSLGDEKLPMPYPDAEKKTDPIYTYSGFSPEEVFAETFLSLGGKFIFCDNEQELMSNICILYQNQGWKQMLCANERLLKLFHNNKIDIVLPANPPMESADACITDCELLIGRTGSIMLSSAQNMGRTAPMYYPVHIVFAYIDQVVYDIDDAIKVMKRKYGSNIPSMINIATGPSRTADIEKTLVVGVHGPAKVYCFLINSERE